ncbi:unnamed protein product [Schistocephalus solidus]|uniref:Uncharacterized protein n=1 Tax=Schistocephalus solidus TaxID=70667 RepID=A0A183SSV1_SCHSO|nr:unnamed protein product [Schistocephalus solidus]
MLLDGTQRASEYTYDGSKIVFPTEILLTLLVKLAERMMEKEDRGGGRGEEEEEEEEEEKEEVKRKI